MRRFLLPVGIRSPGCSRLTAVRLYAIFIRPRFDLWWSPSCLYHGVQALDKHSINACTGPYLGTQDDHSCPPSS
ncbi:hypothetical protein G6F55_014380 [Rhizopus delemar]|nr:hypothetical protein G6F55_014380 [Rhizopus delemar]